MLAVGRTQERSKFARLLAFILVVTLTLSCLAAGPLIPKSYAAPGELIIEINQNFFQSGNVAPPSTTFSYMLTPHAAGSPMPAGGNTLSITGTGSANFIVSFAGGGKYIYDLSLVTTGASGYTLDTQGYLLEVSVMSNLTAVVVIYNQAGHKVASIIYNHSFYANNPPPVDPPPVVPPPVDPPPPTPPPGTPPPVVPTPQPSTTVTADTPFTTVVAPENAPNVEIGNRSVPLFGKPGEPVWALVNLILAILGILLAIWAITRVVMRNKYNADVDRDRLNRYPAPYYLEGELDGEELDEEEFEDEHKRTRKLWFFLVVILAIVGIVFFLLTEDMRLPMVLLDRWTIINAIILLVGIVSKLLAFKKVKLEEVEEEVEVYVEPLIGN